MTRADAFSRDLCRALERKCGFSWRCGKPEKGNRECADVIGRETDKNGKDRVLIEVELRRGAPVENVIKVWRCLENGNGHKKTILFQAFSNFYPKNSRRRLNAEFIAKQVEYRHPTFIYKPLSINYSPRKRRMDGQVMKGGGRRKQHAQKLARRIISALRAMKL